MVEDIWPMRSPEASLGRLYAEYTGSSPDNIVLLSGSGSNRKYYRLSSGGYSIIGVSGRDARENRAFMALSEHMKARGINVPEVYASGPDGLFYLQEDLGSVSLFDAVSSGRYSGHYSPEEKKLLLETISMLPEIQFKGAEGLDFNVCYPEPAFNRRLVMADLNYFKYCFLKPSGIEFNEAELENDFDRLADALLREDGNTFMYRDFQARNVMLKDGIPYFIDFQGGRRGPVHYDVASFVWQARAGYPEDFRRDLVDAYFEHMKGFARTGREEFDERLRLFVFFRTLQVLGAYGFRGNFERKPHFLESIPYAISNLRSILDAPPEGYGYLVSVLGEMVLLPQFALRPIAEVSSRTPFSEVVSVEGASSGLEVSVYSFSYRKGIPADSSGNGGGYVFDCRALPNPGKYEQYRSSTGMDSDVEAFFSDKPQMPDFLDSVFRLVDAHAERFIQRGFTHMMVAFGCTGGQHRSVYCAELTAEHLSRKYDIRVRLEHREQGVSKELSGRKVMQADMGEGGAR